ncbi:MAG: putative lipid II flippase FtsW [Acidimicrobiaceae bacterium]|nr:putative lipid II flippase FtsW [Acidimicrobiaceae bacterium]MDE0517079.1 putative lipid II flippase FtsW [Acidimicrobiaceae bacterium]MXZ95489.1 putative lipid II flippase FtsW [Acidimicrobiaceae bacterium]MYF42845.1 putative lipid II flippase FtsW [Acidimicrobiaceae bacterium]
MIVTERTRARQQALVEARARHASARIPPDGRGPKPPIGRRTGLFLVLFLASVSLVLLGLVMALSATAAPSLSGTDSAWSLFKSQAMWLGVGVLALLVLLRIDYHHWKRLAPMGLGVSVLLLALTAVPSVGLSANGARRWLGVGPVVFQPSELAKIAFVVFVADLLSRPDRHMEDTRATLQPVLMLTGGMAGLLMLQPHLGTTVLIVGMALTMLYFAGARFSHLLAATVVGAGLTAMLIAYSPWRRDRMLGFLDPWADPYGNGYQTLKSLHAMASGGVDGLGLGAGRAKWGFLPYAHTDFIFAVIGEELGMIGSLFVVILFVAIAAAGLGVALRAPDRFGMLLAVGVTAWILLQAALNMGAVLAIFPVVGITLPLLSFGGTSLVATLAAMGVLLNVARQIR